ncbi:membrane traffic protein [Lithospermum erythrorhizon]|uniref:Exocyst subunit Exo70 family protein n=1 Tax=Lithospermum erythrorhizon TaxID=34254 RepID=A0AAV3QR65_LITER
MYEVLADLLQIVNTLFAGDAGLFIRTEFNKLLNKLGHTAKLSFLDLGNKVSSNHSTVPFARGGITQLTKYVMNYGILLESFGDTLNVIFTDESDIRSSNSLEQEISGHFSHYLHTLISILEAKLEERSNLYVDNSLRHIFMMNNIHYIVKKIKHSKMRKYFGDEWMKEHIVKYKQHARTYESVNVTRPTSEFGILPVNL